MVYFIHLNNPTPHIFSQLTTAHDFTINAKYRYFISLKTNILIFPAYEKATRSGTSHKYP